MSMFFKANMPVLKRAVLLGNYSRKELARKSRISEPTIGNIFAGKSATVKTCNKLAKALDVPVFELFDIEGE